MFSFNGVGLRFYGIRKTPDPQTRTATAWASLFFLPLFPLYRALIRPTRQKGFSLQYQELGRTRLQLKEILLTYLFGWILVPLTLFAPLALAVQEVQQFIGVPTSLSIPLMVVALLWFVLFLWKLKDWDDKRWF